MIFIILIINFYITKQFFIHKNTITDCTLNTKTRSQREIWNISSPKMYQIKINLMVEYMSGGLIE